MFASIFILILLLPAACLPLTLDTFFSSADLDEMGISLTDSDDAFAMQGYELVGFIPASRTWETRETNELIRVCQ